MQLAVCTSSSIATSSEGTAIAREQGWDRFAPPHPDSEYEPQGHLIFAA